jgi:hypothetical protein
MAPDLEPYDGEAFGDSDQEPTKEETLTAPTSAFFSQFRRLADMVERQGQAIDRLTVAVAQQTAALTKLTERLTDPRKGRDR